MECEKLLNIKISNSLKWSPLIGRELKKREKLTKK